MSVGPTSGPYQRPSVERDLMELFQRVGDLERITTGIRFTTYPQEGGWLYAETTDASPASPNGYGIELKAAAAVSVESASDVRLVAGAGDVGLNLQNNGGVDIFELQGFGITIQSYSEPTFLQLIVEETNVTTNSTALFLWSSGHPTAQFPTPGAFVRIASGAYFEVRNASDTPLLRVTENGTFHILTGAAWVADL